MSREIKFRAWNGYKMRGVTKNDFFSIRNDGMTSMQLPDPDFEPVLMQFTGLKDRNGVEIYEGDLLNIFFTSGDGEFNHDCIYQASIGDMGDLRFHFRKLMWEDSEHNQYPTATTLCLQYGNLECLWRKDDKRPAVRDVYEENHIHKNKWKGLDKSSYLEVIGNIHQNPELLKD